MGTQVHLEVVASEELSDDVRTSLRALLFGSFAGDFTEADWQHGLGGMHVVAVDRTHPVGHASVISRALYIGEEVYQGGYVEAVAVDPEQRGRGVGAALVRAANALIVERYLLAALSTHVPGFYQPLGWEPWRGPAHVVRAGHWVRVPDEDDGLMVLRPPGSPVVDLTSRIGVDSRHGDDY